MRSIRALSVTARALGAGSARWSWVLQTLVAATLLTLLCALLHEVVPNIAVVYFLFITTFGVVYGLKGGLLAAGSSVAGLTAMALFYEVIYPTPHIHSTTEVVFMGAGFMANGILVGFLAERAKQPGERLAIEEALREKEREEQRIQEELMSTLEHQTGQLQADIELLSRQREELLHLNEELQQKEQALQMLAITDDLTGTYNRRYFWERLQQEGSRSKRYHRPLSCIMMDLDRFKEINDRYGHLCGDRVLAELSGLLRQALRNSDLIARYGGEEFAFILPETDLEQATGVAERICLLLREHSFTYKGHAIRLTASLGVAAMAEGAELDAEALVKQADDTLYQAKMMGGDRVVPAAPIG